MYLLIHKPGHWETINVGFIPLCLENPMGLLQRRSSTRPLHKGAIPTLTSLGGPESIPDYHLGTLHSSAMELRTYSQLSESLALQDFLRCPGWQTAKCTRLNFSSPRLFGLKKKKKCPCVYFPDLLLMSSGSSVDAVGSDEGKELRSLALLPILFLFLSTDWNKFINIPGNRDQNSRNPRFQYRPLAEKLRK